MINEALLRRWFAKPMNLAIVCGDVEGGTR